MYLISVKKLKTTLQLPEYKLKPQPGPLCDLLINVGLQIHVQYARYEPQNSKRPFEATRRAASGGGTVGCVVHVTGDVGQSTLI